MTTNASEHLISCHILASVVAADGVVNEAETAFMTQLMSYLGLTSEEQADVMSLQHGENAASLLDRMSPAAKRDLLDLAVAAVLADGKLQPAEKAMIDQLSKRLGFQD